MIADSRSSAFFLHLIVKPLVLRNRPIDLCRKNLKSLIRYLRPFNLLLFVLEILCAIHVSNSVTRCDAWLRSSTWKSATISSYCRIETAECIARYFQEGNPEYTSSTQCQAPFDQSMNICFGWFACSTGPYSRDMSLWTERFTRTSRSRLPVADNTLTARHTNQPAFDATLSNSIKQTHPLGWATVVNSTKSFVFFSRQLVCEFLYLCSCTCSWFVLTGNQRADGLGADTTVNKPSRSKFSTHWWCSWTLPVRNFCHLCFSASCTKLS